jgi:hypothetical protein
MNLLSLPSEILQTLRMDGEITPDMELCDVPPTWQSRSRSVLQDFGSDVVLTGVSAMWALSAAIRPNIFTASFISSHRRRRGSSALISWEERRLDGSEVFLERGIGITTPLRTMCDVLRFPHFTDRNKHDLETLISMTNTEVADIHVALSEKQKVPYKEMALSRLDLLAL